MVLTVHNTSLILQNLLLAQHLSPFIFGLVRVVTPSSPFIALWVEQGIPLGRDRPRGMYHQIIIVLVLFVSVDVVPVASLT